MPIQGSSSMVPYLPPEVMIEILVQCPVKTLLRFKVVCKLWYSLISSHQFIRRHLSRRAGNTQRIFSIRKRMLYELRYYSVNDSMVLEETSIDIPIRDRDRRRFRIMACDGLICIKEEYSGELLLWNPSTRDSKMLPSISDVGEVRVWKYGFGYDRNSDDYKVLTLVSDGSVIDHYEFSYKSIMYTLRTNSWRWIQNSPRATWFRNTTSTFVSGALHWMASVKTHVDAHRSRMDDVIISFDLAAETYMQVPLPQVVGVSCTLGVGDSKGCLCLLGRDRYDSSNDIWVMKEYGVPESWTKTVKIPMLQGISRWLTPVTWFVEHGEILLRLPDKLASYNLDKDSIRYFGSVDEVGFCYPRCVESLVSPNAYSNLVASRTRCLNIKIGDTIIKEEKDIFHKDTMNGKISEEEGSVEDRT